MLKVSYLPVLLGVLFVNSAYATGFGSLKGMWTSTEPASAGQVIVFPAKFGNYSSALPGFNSMGLISQTDGHNGSQLKVVSQTGLVCYYSISLVKDNMLWQQRDGGSGCPPTISMKRVK